MNFKRQLRNYELTQQSKWGDYSAFTSPHIGCRRCGTAIQKKEDDHPTAITHMHVWCAQTKEQETTNAI